MSQVRGEHVDGKDVLETIDGLYAAFAVANPGVVNHSIERPQMVGLIGKSSSLDDACQVADHHAVSLGRGGQCVSGTLLVAGVEDHLVTGGHQSFRGHQA